MSLHNDFARSGDLLFRWRSYWPLAFIALILLILTEFRYLGDSEALDDLWEAFCLGVSAIGIGLRAVIAGRVPANTSGRNTLSQKADTLNTTGMYSIVRHPLYLGNFFIGLGLALFPHQWWLAVIYTLLFWIYYERIMFAEEAFLGARFGAAFEAWAARTPAFVPAPSRWQPSALGFSWKAMLSREHSTLLGTVAVFTLCEITGDWFLGQPLDLDPHWAALLSTVLLLSLVTRWLKKRGALRVSGR